MGYDNRAALFGGSGIQPKKAIPVLLLKIDRVTHHERGECLFRQARLTLVVLGARRQATSKKPEDEESPHEASKRQRSPK